MWIRSAIVIVMIVGLLSLGCKEGNPVSGGITLVNAEFTPSAPAPPGSHVFLRTRSSDGGRIVLDVVVGKIDEPITGVAVKLTYPDSFSKFTACMDGDLFPPGECFFAEPAPGSGEVFIVRAMTAPGQETAVPADRVVARVEFLVFGAGDGLIVIEGQNLGGGDASAVLDVDGDPIPVQWVSGLLRGV